MHPESAPAPLPGMTHVGEWIPIKRWPYQWPSLYSVRAMIKRAEAARRSPTWARRLPNSRLLVNPRIFWSWLESAQVDRLESADMPTQTAP